MQGRHCCKRTGMEEACKKMKYFLRNTVYLNLVNLIERMLLEAKYCVFILLGVRLGRMPPCKL